MFKNLKMFCEEKQPEDDVFNFLTVASPTRTHSQTSLLNAKLTSYMPGLTAKVFRTYNASVTLEKQLKPTYPPGTSVEEMVVQYNDANREVAVLCNHQRSLPKNWEENTAKKREKLEMMQGQVEALKKMLATVRRGEEIKLMPEKYRSAVAKLEIPEGASEETVKELKLKRQAEVNERAKFAHMFKTQPSEAQVEKRLEMYEARYNSFAIKLKDLVSDGRRIDDQDNNKLVALGTSKINYMDPRITVAWCKRVGVLRRVYW